MELKFVAFILSMFLRSFVTATEVEMQATNLKEQKEDRGKGQRARLRLFFLLTFFRTHFDFHFRSLIIYLCTSFFFTD